ncbi:mitochondrial chaperone [Balamuthia mandrillaris]
MDSTAGASSSGGGVSFNQLLFLVAGGVFVALVQGTLRQFLDLLWQQVSTTLTVNSEDEAFSWLMEWLALQPFNDRALLMSLSSKRPARHQREMGVLANVVADVKGLSRAEKRGWKVKATPGPGGRHIFRHRGTLAWMTLSLRDVTKRQSFGDSSEVLTTLSITCLGRRRALLLSIVEEAKRQHLLKSLAEDKVLIYVQTDVWRGCWGNAVPRSIRSLESLVLHEGLAERAVADLQRFFNSEEWYLQHGIPYRRGYLLYGPPGTGKSSFVLAMASYFGKDVCYLSLRDCQNDQNLSQYFNNVPPNCIILIEDIDYAFPTIRSKSKEEGGESEEGGSGNKDGGAGKLSLAGLLNCIDGLVAQEGSILMATTNNPEKFCPAFIRAGRMDVKLEFGNATKDQARRLFLSFFPEEEDLAKDFAAAIPEKHVAPVELQGWFLRHRDDPVGAVGRVKELLAEHDWMKKQS